MAPGDTTWALEVKILGLESFTKVRMHRLEEKDQARRPTGTGIDEQLGRVTIAGDLQALPCRQFLKMMG